jgi:hypothetical protein
VREVDQHHALDAVGLGLQQVDQLARAAVDGLGERDARDHRLEPAQQRLPDHAPRERADATMKPTVTNSASAVCTQRRQPAEHRRSRARCGEQRPISGWLRPDSARTRT